MAEITALLRGGSRDGESTVVAAEVRRVLANSAAPGLLDVYEATDEQQHLSGNSEPASVYAYVGQEDAAQFSSDDVHLTAPGA